LFLRTTKKYFDSILIRLDLHQGNHNDPVADCERYHSVSTGGPSMITTSEIAVTITIWSLTAAGAFFGTRAVWRRKRQKRAEQRKLPL
jgi:hypothetical protein